MYMYTSHQRPSYSYPHDTCTLLQLPALCTECIWSSVMPMDAYAVLIKCNVGCCRRVFGVMGVAVVCVLRASGVMGWCYGVPQLPAYI